MKDPQMPPACLGLSLIKMDLVEVELKCLAWLCCGNHCRGSGALLKTVVAEHDLSVLLREQLKRHRRERERESGKTQIYEFHQPVWA